MTTQVQRAAGRDAAERGPLYEEITAKIIGELEEGHVPWVRPWRSDGSGTGVAMPSNATTSRP